MLLKCQMLNAATSLTLCCFLLFPRLRHGQLWFFLLLSAMASSGLRLSVGQLWLFSFLLLYKKYKYILLLSVGQQWSAAERWPAVVLKR
jgi:hypothetical protein